MAEDEQCHAALRVAADLAARLGSQLVLVNVRPSPTDLPAGMAAHAELARQRAVESGHRLLVELARELLHDRDARRSIRRAQGRVEFGEPAARLVAVAEETDAAVIVVGARGRGPVGAAILGSVSQRLAAEPSRPLLVVPPKADSDREQRAANREGGSIVCGVDGSTAAISAVRVADRLAAALGLRLVLVHAEQDGAEIAAGESDFEDSLSSRTRTRLRILQRAAEHARDADVSASLAEGSPARALEEVAARESAELIAVGSRGHGALKALALGSVSRTLAAAGHRPVLIANERPSASGAREPGG